MINSVIFPAPKRSYDIGELPEGELVHIPRFEVPCWNVGTAGSSSSGGFSSSTDGPGSGNFGAGPATASALPEVDEGLIPASSPTLAPPAFRPSSLGYTVGILLRCPDQLKPQFLIIYAHPNAVDIGQMRDELDWMKRKVNAHCLLVEFQGYGLNDANTPSEEETNIDVESAYEFALSTLKVPAERIILMGRSIGTGPTSRLAATVPKHLRPAMLVLQCPFSSIKDCVDSLAKEHAPKLASFATSCVADRFDTKKIIGSISCPVILIHGKKDTIVPFSHSETLYSACQRAHKKNVYFHQIENCGHNDLPIRETLAAFSHGYQEFLADKIHSHNPLHLDIAPWFCIGDSAWNKLQEGIFATTSGQTRTELAEQITYNLSTFGSLVRFAWELFQLRQDHDGPGVLSNVNDSLREWTGINLSGLASRMNPSATAASPPTSPAATNEKWTLPRFLDACLAVWGSPLGSYLLIDVRSETDARKGEEDPASSSSSSLHAKNSGKDGLLYFGNIHDSIAMSPHDVSRYDLLWSRLCRSMVHAMAHQLHSTPPQTGWDSAEGGQGNKQATSATATSATTNSATSTPAPNLQECPAPPPVRHPGPDYALYPLRVYTLSENLRQVLLRNIESHVNPHSTVESLRNAATQYLLKLKKDKEDGEQPTTTIDILPKPRAFTQRGMGYLQLEAERFVIDNLTDDDQYHLIAGQIRNLGDQETRALLRHQMTQVDRGSSPSASGRHHSRENSSSSGPLVDELEDHLNHTDGADIAPHPHHHHALHHLLLKMHHLPTRQELHGILSSSNSTATSSSSSSSSGTQQLLTELVKAHFESVKLRDALVGAAMDRRDVDANSSAWNTLCNLWTRDAGVLVDEHILIVTATNAGNRSRLSIGGGEVATTATEKSDARRVAEGIRERNQLRARRGADAGQGANADCVVQ